MAGRAEDRNLNRRRRPVWNERPGTSRTKKSPEASRRVKNGRVGLRRLGLNGPVAVERIGPPLGDRLGVCLTDMVGDWDTTLLRVSNHSFSND